MRFSVLVIGLALAGPALGQDDPSEKDEPTEKVEPADGDKKVEEPAERPPPPPVEMTPERKAKAEYWEKKRITDAKVWHDAVKKATDEWLATAGLDNEKTQGIRDAVVKMLETDNLLRAQMQGGEIKPKEGRERLNANRGALGEQILALAGKAKTDALRQSLTAAGGAF